MCGCESSAATFASVTNIWAKFVSSAYSGRMVLITHRLVKPSGPSICARKTCAIPPTASWSTSRYLPNMPSCKDEGPAGAWAGAGGSVEMGLESTGEGEGKGGGVMLGERCGVCKMPLRLDSLVGCPPRWIRQPVNEILRSLGKPATPTAWVRP